MRPTRWQKMTALHSIKPGGYSNAWVTEQDGTKTWECPDCHNIRLIIRHVAPARARNIRHRVRLVAICPKCHWGGRLTAGTPK